MKYESITIIGLGTLGGFVSSSLANNENLKYLVLVDYDLVEEKNVKNSIYRQEHVGKLKTKCLKNIINLNNPHLKVHVVSEKFIEGETNIPKTDLTIDCRDVTYNRNNQIDLRLYISSRYLMVDCRKNALYEDEVVGKYITELSKEDLRYAGSLTAMLFHSDTISYLINNNIVQKYELDYVKHVEDKCDILYESDKNDSRFINLPDKIYPILETNKTNDIKIVVGNKILPIVERDVPSNTIVDSCNLINLLNQMIAPCCYFNYVISLYKDSDKFILELIPETGAA